MTSTPLSSSPITASVRPRYLTGTGHASPTATVSAAFGRQTWSLKCQITRPIASRAAKTSAPLVTQPSSCPEPTNQIKQRQQIPHRSTPASVRTPPAVSSLEAFRTPASAHPLSPVTGRRPKTLNNSRGGAMAPRTAAMRGNPGVHGGRGELPRRVDSGPSPRPLPKARPCGKLGTPLSR